MKGERAKVPEWLHQKLLAWRRWCLSGYLPHTFHVECESAESHHVGEKGNLYDEPAVALGSARKPVAPFVDHEALEIEKALLKLPRKAALALRLHYVGYPRLPIKTKMRAVGLTHERYFEFVADSAGALAAVLGWHHGQE